MEVFYLRIDNLLKEQKKTQKDFAEYIGLSAPQAYITLRNRGTLPRVDVALRMAEYLDTSVEYLVTGSTKNPAEQKAEQLQKQLNTIRQCVLDNT